MSVNFQAVVIGAGPAGVCVIGELLDLGVRPIAWVDPLFEAGRLPRYVAVPSNTHTSLFGRYATSTASFRAIWEKQRQPGKQTSLEVLEDLQQDAGCPLHLAVDLLRDLTEGLKRYHQDEVSFIAGTVTYISQGVGDAGLWKVSVKN